MRTSIKLFYGFVVHVCAQGFCDFDNVIDKLDKIRLLQAQLRFLADLENACKIFNKQCYLSFQNAFNC